MEVFSQDTTAEECLHCLTLLHSFRVCVCVCVHSLEGLLFWWCLGSLALQFYNIFNAIQYNLTLHLTYL